MSQQQPPHIPDGIVTLRELYTLISGTRNELLAEVGKVTTHVDRKFSEHDTEHRLEEQRRSRFWMWAVTTIIAAAALAVGAYVAAKGG